MSRVDPQTGGSGGSAVGAPPIDLRSDTVTRPTDEMRAAIAAAPVGDDQYGEDPTINALQERVAALLGKEAALWLPSGTMANQVALRDADAAGRRRRSSAARATRSGTRPAASAANAGVQFTEIGARGVFSVAEFVAAVKPRGHPLYPPTTLVEIENTHNRSGGIVFDRTRSSGLCAAARERDIASFLDGARLWNAAVAQRHVRARQLARAVRSRRGRAVEGTGRARRLAARRFARADRPGGTLPAHAGGAMRQVGILGGGRPLRARPSSRPPGR